MMNGFMPKEKPKLDISDTTNFNTTENTFKSNLRSHRDV